MGTSPRRPTHNHPDMSPPSASWSRSQRRAIFSKMVAGERRCGRMTLRRRAELMAYATKLGIDASDAATVLDASRPAASSAKWAPPGWLLGSMTLLIIIAACALLN
ncbi:MAG: hypothetical protein GY842_16675 [bacterium]|nr:hypothetical protein [bacterium]